MTLATIKGRLQTKVLTFLILAGVTIVFGLSQETGAYVDLFMISILVGLGLELLWGVLISYQPGWLAFVLGAVEFILISAVAVALQVDITLVAAAVYYVTAWILIQLFLLYILPVWRLSWIEDGSELW